MKPKFFVGTSGWAYDWNKGGNLQWYIENTRFNAVELNSSFYRFPFPNQVKGWARKGVKLRWSVKVNRIVTHRFRLDERAIYHFQRFRNLFEPMEKARILDFYLIQLPPNFQPKQKNIERLKKFIEAAGLGDRLAIEFRHKDWFQETWIRFLERFGATMVSIDAPDFGALIFKTTDKIYLRLHGRTVWYSHIYTREEVAEILHAVLRLGANEVFIFLNNDHGMLPTGELIIEELKTLGFDLS